VGQPTKGWGIQTLSPGRKEERDLRKEKVDFREAEEAEVEDDDEEEEEEEEGEEGDDNDAFGSREGGSTTLNWWPLTGSMLPKGGRWLRLEATLSTWC